MTTGGWVSKQIAAPGVEREGSASQPNPPAHDQPDMTVFALNRLWQERCSNMSVRSIGEQADTAVRYRTDLWIFDASNKSEGGMGGSWSPSPEQQAASIPAAWPLRRYMLFSEIALRSTIRVAEATSSGTNTVVARPTEALARDSRAHLIRSVVEQPQRSSA